MNLLDHVSITVRNLERVSLFYKAVMTALEANVVYEEAGAIGFGERNSLHDDSHTYVSIFESAESVPDSRRHWCFRAKSMAQVDAFYRAGLAAGGSHCGAPGMPGCKKTICVGTASLKTGEKCSFTPCKLRFFACFFLALPSSITFSYSLEREYHESYYAAFLLDPEGNKVEAVCHRHNA